MPRKQSLFSLTSDIFIPTYLFCMNGHFSHHETEKSYSREKEIVNLLLITDLRWLKKHWEITLGSMPNESLGKYAIMSNFKSLLSSVMESSKLLLISSYKNLVYLNGKHTSRDFCFKLAKRNFLNGPILVLLKKNIAPSYLFHNIHNTSYIFILLILCDWCLLSRTRT